jgi:zinc transport system ATP-binding protein
MCEKIIEVSNLNFENILKNISLEIYKGDFVAITGPNGGGKSTFIKLLLGILEPTNGNIKLFENSKYQIGYVPQQASNIDIAFPATVDEIIKTAFANKNSLFKTITKEEKLNISSLMDLFEISNLKYKLITELSGGQKQRVMIVRALANNPKLLILDEPDIGLDKKSQKQFINSLKEINEKNRTTILFITHHLEEIDEFITKKFNINQGLN